MYQATCLIANHSISEHEYLDIVAKIDDPALCSFVKTFRDMYIIIQ